MKGGQYMQNKKLVLNIQRGTLHKTNGCLHSKVSKEIAKYYDNEDEVIADQTRYFKYCKLCFKPEV